MNIHIENLKKTFGEKTAVDIPAFTIESEDILGFVGNNGAGKTTLFRLLLDLIKADEGTVEYREVATGDGITTINPATSEEWKSFTGAHIDESFLIDFLMPEEYFEFIGKTNGMSKEEVYQRIGEFESLMAGEILGQKKYIRNFSAGNKQKIGIIAAMLSHPKLVILDEPFNFLDPTSQNVLKKTLIDYQHTHHATILVSSHNLQHTIDISNRIALLEHGVIVKDLPNENGSAEKELEDYFGV